MDVEIRRSASQFMMPAFESVQLPFAVRTSAFGRVLKQDLASIISPGFTGLEHGKRISGTGRLQPGKKGDPSSGFSVRQVSRRLVMDAT